jgi:hypothetical protein
VECETALIRSEAKRGTVLVVLSRVRHGKVLAETDSEVVGKVGKLEA